MKPNPNTVSDISPAEIMFARKIRSVVDKLLSNKKKGRKFLKKFDTQKYFKPGENVCFRAYKNEKECWKDGVVERHIAHDECMKDIKMK